ncbi:MAG: discoidin domain-containing protein [Pyrinomonadaceae bacterium]
MKPKGYSSTKRSVVSGCLWYLGRISITRPMVTMLLITVFLTTAMVTDAQIIVDRKVNKFVQIGAKGLSIINSPYAKVLGGALGFLIAEEKLPEYKELKASLQKEWLLDIDDKNKEAYETFIIAKKKGYMDSLAKVKRAEETSVADAILEAKILSGQIYTDIPLFHPNVGGKSYPAGPTLPYLFAAMSFDLDLLTMQIDWQQQLLDAAIADGDQKAATAARKSRDTSVNQYNVELVDFWQKIQTETVRAKKERGHQVECRAWRDDDGFRRYVVRDHYDGRETEGEGPNLRYYKFIPENQGYAKRIEAIATATSTYNNTCDDTLRKARIQITAETNKYDLAARGYYQTTSDNLAPIKYSCTEKIRAIDGASLHLSCPIPGGGGVDVRGDLAASTTPLLNESGDIGKWLYDNRFRVEYFERLRKIGIPYPRTEDGSLGLTDALLVEPDFPVRKITNTDDSGPGSLRQAVEDGGQIDLSPVEGQTITLTSGPIYVYARPVKFIKYDLNKPVKVLSQTHEWIVVNTGGIPFENPYYFYDEQRKIIECGYDPATPNLNLINCPTILPQVSLKGVGAKATAIATTPTTARTNVALASNGGVVSASSTIYEENFPLLHSVASVTNGDRTGSKWGNGGGWNDATSGDFPDWLQIDFSGTKSIDEINVVTLQDGFGQAGEPTAETKFTGFGIKDFDVQYWNGTDWVTVQGGSVKENDLVIRTFKFTPVSTTKIRVTVNAALQDYSRIIQLEAWGKN